MWKVYRHTNNINGKVYIGITGKDENERWKGGFGYRTQPVFFGGMVEFGWINFKHEILFENLSHQEALDIETSLIKKFASNNPKYGYNARTTPNDNQNTNYEFADIAEKSKWEMESNSFFKKWAGIKIFDKELFKKEAIEVLPKTWNTNCRRKGIKSINFMLKENNLPYSVITKRSWCSNARGLRHWMVVQTNANDVGEDNFPE